MTATQANLKRRSCAVRASDHLANQRQDSRRKTQIHVAQLVLFLVALLDVTQVSQVLAAASNAPFKTSFVSSSDYPVRRSGGLIAMPLANTELQHQSEAMAVGSPFDPNSDEQTYAITRGSGFSLFREEPSKQSVANLDQSESQNHEHSHQINQNHESEQSSRPEGNVDHPSTQLDDLMVSQSADSRARVEQSAVTASLDTNSSSSQEALTSTSPPPTTTTQTTTSATSIYETTKRDTIPTTTVSVTASPMASTTTISVAPITTTATDKPTTRSTTIYESTPQTATTKQETVTSNPSTPSSSSTQKVETEKLTSPTSTISPLVSSVATRTLTQRLGSSINQLSKVESPITLRSSEATNDRRDQSADLDGFTLKPQDNFSSNRSSRCSFGSQDCKSVYFVAAVPVVEQQTTNSRNSTNSSRVVNEFFFLPESSTLTFEDSAYSTRKPGQDTEPLVAEHRELEIDTGVDSNSSFAGDVELDYMSSPDLESRLTPGADISKTSPLPAVAADQRRESPEPAKFSISQLAFKAANEPMSPLWANSPNVNGMSNSPKVNADLSNSTFSENINQTTTTTKAPVRTSQSTSFSVRVTSSPASQVLVSSVSSKKHNQQVDLTTPRQLSSVSIQTASVTSASPLATTTTTTTTTTETKGTQAMRANHKLMRVTDSITSTSSVIAPRSESQTLPFGNPSTRRPLEPQSQRSPTTRRAKSIAEANQHRAFYSEPSGDQRRRTPSKNYSPLVNGADEEEANILTRYSLPSQFVRLSSLSSRANHQQVPSVTLREDQMHNRRTTRFTISSTEGPKSSRIRVTDQRLDTKLNTQSPLVTTAKPLTPGPKTTVDQQTLRLAQVPMASIREPSVTTTSNLEQMDNAKRTTSVDSSMQLPIERVNETSNSSSQVQMTTSLPSKADGLKVVDAEETAKQPESLRKTTPIGEMAASQAKVSANNKLDTRTNDLGDSELRSRSRLSSILNTKARLSPKEERPQVPNITTVKEPQANLKLTVKPGGGHSETFAVRREKEQKSVLREEIVTLISSSSSNDISSKSHTTLTRLNDSPALSKQSIITTPATTVGSTSSASTTIIKAIQNSSSSSPVLESQLRRLVDDLGNLGDDIEDQLTPDSSQAKSKVSDTRRVNSYGVSNQKKPALEKVTKITETDTKWNQKTNDDGVDEAANSQTNILPGRPGLDYPIHAQVPKTSFDCRDYELSGFYADVESDCQAYHSCHKGRGGRHTFLCPNGTLFSQDLLTCDWWYNVECSASKVYLPAEPMNRPIDRTSESSSRNLNELSVA